MKLFEITYATWKTLTTDNGFTHYYRYVGRAGTAGDHELVEVYAGNRSFVFQASASGADETDWDTTFKSAGTEVAQREDGHALVLGTPKSGYDAEGHQKMVQEPRPGSEKYFYTHNLCDPCTWFEGAVAVTEAAGTDSGDSTTWTFADVNFIDLRHGRVFKEDQIANQSSYDILVEVDSGGGWAAQTENTWGQTDNDFTFDYVAGEVTFNSALPGGSSVRVSGYKAAGSAYSVSPATGKRVKLEYVEVQYTQDIQMQSSIDFGIYGYVQVFAPALWVGNGGPYPANTKIPLVSESYKRLFDFFQESTGPYPVLPPHGGDWKYETVTGLAALESKMNSGYYEKIASRHNGTDWEFVLGHMESERGVHAPVITIPFQYLAFRDLRDSYGMEIRVSVNGDVPVSGEFATVTFYSTTEDE